MVACTACGAQNPEGSRFCGSCGAVLDTRCPSCGAPYGAGTSFCRQCGSQLSPPPSSGGPARGSREGPSATGVPAPGVTVGPTPADTRPSTGGSSEPVAERRICSVLFADLVGFTPLSENRDPEEVREILSRYFDVARQLVGRYGGTVEKFIGDAVMAVWGTPVVREGDAERAVRAALDLVQAVEVLGDEVFGSGQPDGQRLSARAGVVTGEVAATIGAVGEGMVAGDAVNTASRVQAAARPGSVLVDEATRRLTENAVAFEDAGAHELKGKEAPEQLHRARRVLAGMGGTRRSAALEPPFLGRDAELRTLKELFHIAAERRTPRLVVVTGPAGVGKSRLGWEFEKYVDGIADTVLWHRGRCLSYGEGVAFWALAEIVRQRFGIAEQDTTEVAAGKLHEGLVRFVPDPSEREYVGLRLSRLLGVPYPTEAKAVLGREELFAGWRLFFERLAAVAPVAMLIEDSQYADEALLAFVEHLVEWSRDLPIFVLLFARPGLAVIDSGYGIGRNRSTLSLDPLDGVSMTALVGSLVPGMPADALAAIAGRAQGIPLFAVETVRSLIDQGVVAREGDAHRLVGEIGALQVPESLHGLLAARLDALGNDLRSLVADAAVLGSTFPADALVAVSGRDEAGVAADVAELVRRDVFQVLADPLSPERGSLRFSQEMLRQVAYETLSKRDRKARHLAAAAHLRSAFANEGEEIADAVARHYLDALASEPSAGDAAHLRGVALQYLTRAAERAELSGALVRASESFATAAGLADAPAAAELFERAANAALGHADFETAIAYAEAAAGRWASVGEPRAAARAGSLKGQALRLAGRNGQARAELSAALEVLRPEPDGDTVRALEQLAGVDMFGGKTEDAERLATEALALGQALGPDDARLGSCFVVKGIAAAFADRPVEAAAYFEFAVRLSERAGDTPNVARARLNLSNVLAEFGDPEGALDAARSAAELARRTGLRHHVAMAAGNEAVALIELGRWDDAEAVLRHAEEDDEVDSVLIGDLIGWLAAVRGDAEGTARALERVAAGRSTEDEQELAMFGMLDTAAADCRGDVAAALRHANGVLARRHGLGMMSEAQRFSWPVAARAARRVNDRESLAELIAMLAAYSPGHLPPLLRAERSLFAALAAIDAGDDSDSAFASLASAVDGLRDVGNPYELGHALCEWGEVLLASGRADAASGPLAEAVRIAEKLGCPPLATRASGLAARSAAVPASTRAGAAAEA